MTTACAAHFASCAARRNDCDSPRYAAAYRVTWGPGCPTDLQVYGRAASDRLAEATAAVVDAVRDGVPAGRR